MRSKSSLILWDKDYRKPSDDLGATFATRPNKRTFRAAYVALASLLLTVSPAFAATKAATKRAVKKSSIKNSIKVATKAATKVSARDASRASVNAATKTSVNTVSMASIKEAISVDSIKQISKRAVAAAYAFFLCPTVKKVLPVSAAALVSTTLLIFLARQITRGGSTETTKEAFEPVSMNFPGALSNRELVTNIESVLSKYGYTRDNTLLATSLCADEICRVLERDLAAVYSDNFSMGGLAGFPFGGRTALGAMTAHVPANGNAFLIYGPHVGVNENGIVGTVERRGIPGSGGSCCGSAIAGWSSVEETHFTSKSPETPALPIDIVDAQQSFVQRMLWPYYGRLKSAENKMLELPFCLYDAQKRLVERIVSGGCKHKGTLAVMGGIQINTPASTSDFFLPLSFELYDSNGRLLRDFLPSIREI